MSNRLKEIIISTSLLLASNSYAWEVGKSMEQCKKVVIELMDWNKVVYPVENNKGKIEQLEFVIKWKEVWLYLPESEILVASSTIEGKNTKWDCFIKDFEVK